MHFLRIYGNRPDAVWKTVMTSRTSKCGSKYPNKETKRPILPSKFSRWSGWTWDPTSYTFASKRGWGMGITKAIFISYISIIVIRVARSDSLNHRIYSRAIARHTNLSPIPPLCNHDRPSASTKYEQLLSAAWGDPAKIVVVCGDDKITEVEHPGAKW